MTLKAALLGAGRIGQVHAPNIARHEDSVLAAVADAHAPAAELCAQKYGAEVKSADDIIADDSIGAVLIASPTGTHCDLIDAAAAAGKAVLCEKPLDLSLARARACLEKNKSAARPVMIGFNRRFDPNFAALKAGFDAGDIGKAELLSITSFDPAPPPAAYIEVSGGLFRDMTIHDFDIACWIMGAPPETVTAKASSLVDPAIAAAGDVDTAVVTLTWADGRMAVIKNSRRAAYGYDQRIELLGAQGLLSAGNVLENTVQTATKTGVTSAKPEHFFLERYRAAYAVEWAAFMDAAVRGAPVTVGLRDGVTALAVAEAAAQSHANGRTAAVEAV
ncbi:MAG: inositol 2-dehydrogenase [Rhodospirillales bacterium]